MSRQVAVNVGVVLALWGGVVGAGEDELAPAKGWRLKLAAEAVTSAPEGAAGVPGLCRDEGAAWPEEGADKGQTLSVDVDLGEAAGPPLLLVVEVGGLDEGESCELALGAAKAAGKSLRGVAAETVKAPKRARWDRSPRQRLEARFVLPKKTGALQLKVVSAEAHPKIERMRIFQLDEDGKNDCWLFLGSGLTAAAIDAEKMESALRSRYEGYDPYVINAAGSSDKARDLKVEIAELLNQHPYARYIAIHIGGADVSAVRPYPKGSANLKKDLEIILKTIVKARRIPILARLSYRAYRERGSKDEVAPEEEGSGPYVENIYDPLIKKYCEAFFDKGDGKGFVDMYRLFKENPKLLRDDGVMPNEAGSLAMREVWLRRAGGIVYAGEAGSMPDAAELGGMGRGPGGGMGGGPGGPGGGMGGDGEKEGEEAPQTP